LFRAWTWLGKFRTTEMMVAEMRGVLSARLTVRKRTVKLAQEDS
jgi:hypothetical protein